ncbi:hypothetical protein DEA8626_03478 [Defluviimonas aquaemixtae]|uniref:Uncharacterized protein n=1 Tax=Albidovulum aquaemixtae TaxID=1542388 RepID=A0A2R8BM00_9RHOB|nr:hypothetical protein [Defluviimonas aquaemixtae]SPH24426.1 hypothetical protein DEA8626_03478 [Defluviimonas aquaemixtae]
MNEVQPQAFLSSQYHQTAEVVAPVHATPHPKMVRAQLSCYPK